MARERAVANDVLDGFGKLADQSQPPRHPALSLVETPREILLRQTEALLELDEKPSLFHGTGALGAAHELLEHQGLGLVDFPQRHHRLVDGKLLERPHSFVTVDHDETALLLGFDHHQGMLLAGVQQRRHQPPLLARVLVAQGLEAKLELMEIDLHAD